MAVLKVPGRYRKLLPLLEPNAPLKVVLSMLSWMVPRMKERLLLLPASAASVVLALAPVSSSFHPVGRVDDVPEVISVLKF